MLSANGAVEAALPASLFITIATLGPTIGAVSAAAYESGRSGVRALLSQVVRWRVGWRWYMVVLAFPALAHEAINAYPSPWNTAVYLLPESARGIHIQIPVTVVLVVLAVLLVALKGKVPRPSSLVA